MKFFRRALLAALLGAAAAAAQAQETTIRRNLAERIPQMGAIDEVRRTPMNGLYEVRVGTDLFYTDAQGNFVIQGQLIDTKNKRNLTEERMDKLLAIDFASLPVADAFTIVRGNGKRKLAVFQDPNCGYCKRFERDLLAVDNITIHMFLFPVLGPDSMVKSRNIWCARDKGKSWADWMVRDQQPPQASCDTAALNRNIEFGRRYKINGTPTLVFANGNRVPGAISAAEVEKYLAQAQ